MYPTMGVLFSLLSYGGGGRVGEYMSNKKPLTAGFSLACLKIRSRNEAINSSRKETDLLAKCFLLPILSTSILLLVSELI